jgi:hypothetical protein
MQNVGPYGHKKVQGLTLAQPGEIQKIHAHLMAGNQILIQPEGGRGTVLKKGHVDYIRADGTGYRLGWPGKKSVYVVSYHVFFVEKGYRF